MSILQSIPAALNWNLRVNENFTSVSPAALYGIDPSTTTGLTFGYLGGQFNGVTVANGTVALTASATNYVVAHRTTGAVTVATSTTNWLNTSTYMQLYQLVAGASTFTIASTSDKRQAFGVAGGGGGSGTVTSVAMTLPGVMSVSGSPITTSGTFAVTAVDAGSDKLLFWDDSANDWAYLTLGTGLSITGTTINASGGGGAADMTTVSALTISAGVVNIDCSLGDYFTLALNANVTSITFSNTPGSGKGASKMIRITQDSTARTVAWPASFKWEGGSPGSVSTGSGVIDLLAISTFDNGTAWQATLSKARA